MPAKKSKPTFTVAPVGSPADVPEYVWAILDSLLHRKPVDFNGSLVPAPIIEALGMHFIEKGGVAPETCTSCIDRVKRGEQVGLARDDGAD